MMADQESVMTVDADGSRLWYLNGQLHRTDGPAVEWADGSRQWWINGQWFSFKDWSEEVDVSDEERMALILKWG
jgi:starvation-inducible outer membrane lipoprotein